MANLIRVSGTVQYTPSGPTTISSPNGSVTVNANAFYVVNTSTTVSTASNYSPSAYSIGITNDARNVDNPAARPFNAENIYGSTEQRQKGAVYIAGGVGIEKDLNVGGFIYGRIAEAVTSTNVIVTSTNIDETFYPLFTDTLNPVALGGARLYGDEEGAFSGLTYNPNKGLLTVENIKVSSNTASTTTNTGALVVEGGVGISGALTVDDIYTKVLTSLAGNNVQIAPPTGVTEVIGDIRVTGKNPIGTAPVVTNVLYVTMDGDDTNDGRAMDPSRACRTISGAVSSPYYQSGTQIRVSPGHYLEDNPIRLKPYTSVMGSDIRTTSIEPINKTQDLWHLESGCYLAFMQFLNGRSGLLEGPYAREFNRGAYCTAFPPLEGDERIDLFHSPYVQNCTNLSGPWLRDGTLFTPNQTVQVPLAVGTGTWVSNTTSIVVRVASGTIEQGMAVNSGQQNPGFFNARTLLLANKPFLQEQVVAYVNQTYPGFEYSQEKCFRDVGILVENVAYDASFGGNQKSIESGLAYWNGVISRIAGQETQTIDAINYLEELSQLVITNSTCTDILSGQGKYVQVINTVLVDGDIASSSITDLFSIITDIIASGPTAAPAAYTSTGPDAAFVSAEILMQANRSFIQEDTINYINNTVKQFPYGKEKFRRGVKLVLDSIAGDLLYPSVENSQSNFAGLQYWNQDGYNLTYGNEVTTATAAISYLKTISAKIIQNITEYDDNIVGISRYQNTTPQVTNIESATLSEVSTLSRRFDEIVSIVEGNKTGWSDKIIPNGTSSNFISVIHGYQLLIGNRSYLQDEVVAFINAEHPGVDQGQYREDIGHIIDAVAFDLLNGGNRQSVQVGLGYYSFDGSSSNIDNEQTQTVDAFDYLKSLVSDIVQNIPVTNKQTTFTQDTSLPAAGVTEGIVLQSVISTVTNIITNGPSVAAPVSVINLTKDLNQNVSYAWEILRANKDFIAAEVIAYVDETYNLDSYQYDEAKCYRDIGLIVDAVSQDILLGGNQKSVEAGLAYWNAGYNYVADQVTTTTMAINYAKDLALDIIANNPVTPQTSTISTQVINTFFQYGGDYMPQQAISRNFNIITTIIENGPIYAPPVHAGGGVFALTGINGLDVKISPIVTSVSETMDPSIFVVGLNTATIGFGNNATLYFGNTAVYPALDDEVDALSLELSGSTSTWHQRKIDPIGSMGGSLVDGAVISDRSPIQSFVYDAFTQLTQGGKGVHITNDGYAQLVSVFTIFSSVGVQTDSGGIASIVNSNANFGDICLLAKGYGKRKFSGTVYNPSFKAYPDSPGVDGLNQYYPNGFWPSGGKVEIFTPDIDNRPHISLVMEIEPPADYINEQALPGFLNAQPSKGVLTTGSIVISDIDTDGIAVGNYLYVRDQNNSFTGTNGFLYSDTDTVVVDIGYRSVTLSKALTSGGSDPDFGEQNTGWFNLYFCGNSYYTVLSSEVATNPRETGTNILSVSNLPVDQVAAHVDALGHLNNIITMVIDNQFISPASGTSEFQVINPLISGGAQATAFINLRFTEMINIINAADIASAEAVIPKKFRNKTGTVSAGAGSAITLIKNNTNFIVDEVSNYIINTNVNGIVGNYDVDKCKRDIKIILQRLIYDLETGGRYNCVMVGLSYWSRNGTHHIVQLGETVRRADLFPDGATVNFYQRSYISASGYVFEYVGAGTNYGSLPQVGRADPVQGKETVQLDSGKVFFTSTDQNGDFRIGPGLVISQATGVLSGRTFTKSLFANMTPFILAIEGGFI